MSNTVCICCAGRMTEVSVSTKNHNICVDCEQLLEKDVREFDALWAARLATQQNVTHLHEARPLEKIAA